MKGIRETRGVGGLLPQHGGVGVTKTMLAVGRLPPLLLMDKDKLTRGAIPALTRVQLVLASLRRRPGKQDLRQWKLSVVRPIARRRDVQATGAR